MEPIYQRRRKSAIGERLAGSNWRCKLAGKPHHTMNMQEVFLP
jgi:hypothetical protein